MKTINIKESLIKIDRETDFRYTLTDLYEACMLDDGKKGKLVQYIEDRDIPGMSAMLSNEAGVMAENVSDDISDEELNEIMGNPEELADCPACGDVSFDTRRGRCNKCSYRESLNEWFVDEDEDGKTPTYEFVSSKSVEDSDGFMTDYTWYKTSDGRNVFVFGDSDYYRPEDGYFDHEEEDDVAAEEWFSSYTGFGDSTDESVLMEGPFAVVGDALGKGVKDLWKGAKNFGKGLVDTGKDIAKTAKAGYQAAKETKTAAKIRDAARSVKHADNLDQFKQDYQRRQDKRKRSDAKRDTVYRGKLGSTIGDIQDWKFVVGGKKLSYDKFMQLPKDQRLKLLRTKQVKIYDISGRETSLAAQANRLREKLLEALLLEYSEYRKMLNEGVFVSWLNSEVLTENYTHFIFKSGANPYIAKTEDEAGRILRKYKNKAKKIKDGQYEIDDSDSIKDKFAVDANLTERVGPTHPEEDIISEKLMSIPGTTKVEFDWSNGDVYRVPNNHLIILVFCRDGFDDPYFDNRYKWKRAVMNALRGMGWTLEDPIEDNDTYLYLVMQKRDLKEATAVLDRPRVSNVHTHTGSFSGIIDAHMDEINDMINANVPASHIVHCLRDWVSEAGLTKANARYAQSTIARMAKMRSATDVGMYIYNIRLKAEDDSYGSIDSQIFGKRYRYEGLNKTPLGESVEEEDKPFTHSQIFDELKRETSNFSIGTDRGIYSFEKEAKMAEKILKKHYNDVKVTEHGNDFMIEFSGPKNEKKKVNESKSLTESRGRFELEVWVPGSGGDDRERFIMASNNLQEIIDKAYEIDLDGDEAFYLRDMKDIYPYDLDQCYDAEELEDAIYNEWHYTPAGDMRKTLGKMLLPQNEAYTENPRELMKNKREDDAEFDEETGRWSKITYTDNGEPVDSFETSKEWEHRGKDGKIGRIRQSDGKGGRKPLTRDRAKEIAKFRGHEDDELYPVNEAMNAGPLKNDFMPDFSDYDRWDRISDDEEAHIIAPISYMYGVTWNKAHELLPTLSAEEIEDAKVYYNLRDLPSHERLAQFDKYEKSKKHVNESKSTNEDLSSITSLADDCGKNTFKKSARDVRFTFEDEKSASKFMDKLKEKNIHYDELPGGIIKVSKSSVLDESKSIYEESFNEAFEHPQNKGPHWYLCKHGIGPGALPKGVNVVDTVDDEENPYRCYVALDKVLTTDELKQFEMKEQKPPKMMEKQDT